MRNFFIAFWPPLLAPLLGILSRGGSYNITFVCLSLCLSVCPSVCLFVCLFVCPSICQFSIFVRQGLRIFSVFFFFRNLDNWNIEKPTKLIFQENYFLLNFGEKKFLTLVFLGNNLKWKLILLLIFHRESHIWQNSSSQVMSQNTVDQLNCRIL